MHNHLAGVFSRDGGSRLEVLVAEAGGPDAVSTGLKRSAFSPALECPQDAAHWNAYLDVNGDGRPDLVVTCKQGTRTALTIMLNSQEGYSMAGPALVLPEGASQVTFVDVDADGSPDLVFTVCDDGGACALHVVYNMQPRFCTGTQQDASDCRSNVEHFKAPSRWGFELGSDAHQQIALPAALGMLLRTDPVSGLAIPLSFGDYDLDGFPDLLLTFASSRAGYADAHPVLLRNVACDTARPGCAGPMLAARRRSFAREFENTEVLNTRGLVHAAFADIYGRGSLAIVANGYGADKVPSITVFGNDAFNDAYFVKSESLNGVCPAPCARKNTGSRAANPFGVNYIGGTFRLSFTDLDGSVRVRSGSQLAQTSNRALQLPCAIFGLGRTNSFVDTFSAGSSARTRPHTHTSTHIIPNSDLIVIPPHADSPAAWQFQIHIHPAAHFIWVTVALAISLTILTSLTAFFKIKEKREDDAEKKKRAHAVNFDAM